MRSTHANIQYLYVHQYSYCTCTIRVNVLQVLVLYEYRYAVLSTVRTRTDYKYCKVTHTAYVPVLSTAYEYGTRSLLVPYNTSTCTYCTLYTCTSLQLDHRYTCTSTCSQSSFSAITDIRYRTPYR